MTRHAHSSNPRKINKGRSSGKPLVTVVPGTMRRISSRSAKTHSRVLKSGGLRRFNSISSGTDSSSATRVGVADNSKLQPIFSQDVYAILHRAPTPHLAMNEAPLAPTNMPFSLKRWIIMVWKKLTGGLRRDLNNERLSRIPSGFQLVQPKRRSPSPKLRARPKHEGRYWGNGSGRWTWSYIENHAQAQSVTQGDETMQGQC